jgi:predicted MFS family arabinose efflux permease
MSMRSTIALAAAVQFVVLLDFALILPLGPDLVGPLATPAASLGLLVAAYTGAAALAGVLASGLLDRFERRAAMFPLLLGLALAAVAAAMAPNFAALLGARTLAGLCAAPISALILSLIADEVPESARGRALGIVLSANAVAGVFGVPGCLWLSEHIAWWMAFAAVALVAVLAAAWVGASARIARQREAVDDGPAETVTPAERVLQRRAHALTFLAFAATFALTPNLSAYVQFNLGYPRSDIPLLYMVAGACSFIVMRLTGLAVDRRGPALIGSVALGLLAVTVALFLAMPTPLLWIELAMILLLVSLASRNVALRTLTSRVPKPAWRARFMSLQATAQQLGAVTGVLLAMVLLRDRADGGLAGMQALARCSIVLLIVLPPLMILVERGATKLAPVQYS